MRGSTVIALAMMAACAPVPPAEADSPEGGGKCDAAPVQSLLGQQRSETLGNDAKRRAGAARLRWIEKGAAVTMDYSETRLNIQLDGQNRIVKIYCG